MDRIIAQKFYNLIRFTQYFLQKLKNKITLLSECVLSSPRFTFKLVYESDINYTFVYFRPNYYWLLWTIFTIIISNTPGMLIAYTTQSKNFLAYAFFIIIFIIFSIIPISIALKASLSLFKISQFDSSDINTGHQDQLRQKYRNSARWTPLFLMHIFLYLIAIPIILEPTPEAICNNQKTTTPTYGVYFLVSITIVFIYFIAIYMTLKKGLRVNGIEKLINLPHFPEPLSGSIMESMKIKPRVHPQGWLVPESLSKIIYRSAFFECFQPKESRLPLKLLLIPLGGVSISWIIIFVNIIILGTLHCDYNKSTIWINSLSWAISFYTYFFFVSENISRNSDLSSEEISLQLPFENLIQPKSINYNEELIGFIGGRKLSSLIVLSLLPFLWTFLSII
ncbi:hypothetical protein [Marinibactrum halimedae]|uniref:hypothetical protein n=1 Tax=Marinibactrum halimedae TaxID=1444977 RepID=UPI001E2E904D|nr:hypothetical protein [Marinibactrum halimedae]MCD9458055.1 hypothetical protein [Marinibactrum halimedae]